jgi:mono/diheme cytochrome c family protein
MFSSTCRILAGLALGALCVCALAQEKRTDVVPAPVTIPIDLVADLDNGSTIYDKACSACHGETGQGGQGGGAAINDTALSLSQLILLIDGGRNTMPAFGVFSDQELLDISTFVKDSL